MTISNLVVQVRLDEGVLMGAGDLRVMIVRMMSEIDRDASENACTTELNAVTRAWLLRQRRSFWSNTWRAR